MAIKYNTYGNVWYSDTNIAVAYGWLSEQTALSNRHTARWHYLHSESEQRAESPLYLIERDGLKSYTYYTEQRGIEENFTE